MLIFIKSGRWKIGCIGKVKFPVSELLGLGGKFKKDVFAS